MLSKSLGRVNQIAEPLFKTAQRGIYAPGTEPKVFINKHTKVICQGMTGKHVRKSSKDTILNNHIFRRVLSTHSNLSLTAPRWSVESISRKLAPSI